METLHSEAKSGQIGSTVLMLRDPLRAKYIAQTYLTDAMCYNRIRGVNGYIGCCERKKISVQGSGMGISSMDIYAYEFYQNYDVDTVIHIGTAGAIHRDVKAGGLIFAIGYCTNSNFPAQCHLSGIFAPVVDFSSLSVAVSQAQSSKVPFRVGSVLSSDVFYEDRKGEKGGWKKMGVLVQEMETLFLYYTAARTGKRALGMLTADSSIHTDGALINGECERNLDAMIQCVLEIA